MAERTYQIEIKLPTDSGGSSSESPVSKASTNSSTASNSGGTSSSSGGSTSKGWLESNAQSAQSAVKKIVSFSTAASLADKFISYNVNTISLRTGATEYEQKVQFGYSTAKSVITPIVIGAATGGLAGAVIGLAFSGVTQLISYSQNAQTISYNKQLENISQSMAQTRAGVSGSRQGG